MPPPLLRHAPAALGRLTTATNVGARTTLRPTALQLLAARRTLFGLKRGAFNPQRPLLSTLLLRGKHPILRFFGIATFSVVFTVVFGTAGLLAWDASTYHSDRLGEVLVNPLALNPERGGKKNLKIARILMDDEEDAAHASQLKKPKLVILGGGWGGVAVMQHLKPDEYHVVVIAPDNYALFTPLLPSATVGTVEPRSLIEPLRKILARVKGHYLQASAVDIDMTERLIEVKGLNGDENFYVPYDKCIVAVGAVANAHGVPGLEHAFSLKTIEDVLLIRRRIMNNIELAALPSTTEADRKRLLSFVVCGGGPTGIEVASEFYELLNEDVLQYFPKKLRKDSSVHVIQSRDHILNTYSEKISQYAEKKFLKDGIDLVINSRVKEVTPTSITYTEKDPATGKKTDHTIPSGLTLWSTGIAMNPLTRLIAQSLPNQYHNHALEVDSQLRVRGAPLGTLYAIGDAATVETNLVDHLFDFVDKYDSDNDGKISLDEFNAMTRSIKRSFPNSQLHVEKATELFDKYDSNHDGLMSLNELADMFRELSNKLTALPATAQVADQQGKYLAKKFNKLAAQGHAALQREDIGDDIDDMIYEPFKYRHLGSLAYLGQSAVFDIGSGYSFAGGLAAMYAWRAVYWSEQVSLRTRLLLMLDWIKRGVFGRDLSKI